jgi:hypothetical protein
LYQPNYSLKEHLINPTDQLRQESLARLQGVLPFSARPVQVPLPTSITGAQYEFGLRQIAAEKYVPAAPGIFVSGPFTIDGMPEVVRLDMEFTGTIECHLICRPNGDPTGDYTVQELTSGTAISFPDAWPGAHLNTADLFLQWIFRSNDAVLTRFLLQVTKGA